MLFVVVGATRMNDPYLLTDQIWSALGGQTYAGDYDRHAFCDTIPKGEPCAGTPVLIV
jgi:hypothetical protein